MPEKLRVFIAIELPEKLQMELSDFVQTIKDPQDKITWVPPNNIHITLKFLGDVPIGDIGPIKEAISNVAENYSPFEATIKGTGVFPDQRNPRVIWIGMDTGKEKIKNIYIDLEDKLVSIRIPREERSFTPHITLGRIKYIKDMRKFSEVLSNHKEDVFGNFMVDSISLIKSTLTPNGSVYEVLYRTPIGVRR